MSALCYRVPATPRRLAFLGGLCEATREPAELSGGRSMVAALPELAEAAAKGALMMSERRASGGPQELAQVLPRSVYGLRTEAHLKLIEPWFFRSFPIPGDVCEFGCFRGTMSIKFAFALKAAGLDKTVYAFDTFEGFQMADPSGGSLGVGAYSDNDNAFDELGRWSAVIPVKPMKGDAREVCKQLANPLSFVWLDLDFDILMAPVLDVIWPLIGPETIIGIDDVGRPETPSVGPWVDRITAAGRLIELERHDGDFIRFFRKNGSWAG